MAKPFAALVRSWRSLPLVSLGIAALWLVAWLVLEVGYGSLLRDTRAAHFEAARLTAHEPLIQVVDEQFDVVRAVDPDYEVDPLLELMRGRANAPSVLELQAAFDEAAGVASDGRARHPFRTLGVVPARFEPVALATHWLVHLGVLHLLATLILWLLVAPALERLWGRGVLFATTLGVGLASGGVHALAHASSLQPMIGGGALVAALVAALLVRRAKDEVDFAAWLGEVGVPLRFDLVAPGALVVVPWVLYEAALWSIARGALPGNADNTVGYSAHAAGFVLGGGLAWIYAKANLEKEKAPERPVRTSRFDLEKTLALRESGQAEEAFALLEAEVERSARNRNVVMAYWDMALEREEADAAAPVLVRLIEEELRRGAEGVAAGHWNTLRQSAPHVLLGPGKLIRIAKAINQEHGEDAVTIALTQALDEKNEGLTSGHAATIARMACELDPQLAARAARIALRAKDLEAALRSELELLTAALAPDAPSRSPAAEKDDPAPSVFFEESDRSAFGEADDLSAIGSENFPDGAISEATPISADGRSLQVKIDGRGFEDVDWSRMRAVAIVGIHGLAEKPVVVIDVLIDGRGTPQPLSVLRMRCDRFDPRVLVPQAPGSKQALQALAAGFRKKGLAVMADLTATGGDSRPVFQSLDAYHEKILKPVGSDLG